jgi:hypothetical protein
VSMKAELADVDVLLVQIRRELDELWAGFEDAHADGGVDGDFDAGSRHEAGRKSFLAILQALRGVELELGMLGAGDKKDVHDEAH